jgi:dihydrofolate synthase/folylpolyglutamate synthase
MAPITTYSQAVAYFLSIPKFTSKHTLESTRDFLDQLGNPGTSLPIIHVAGTNGKGSVCAYLSSLLREAGYKVSVFTSPHLVDIRERFCVSGQIGELITEEAFLETFQKVYKQLDFTAIADGNGYHPTFFEYLFFMAMLLFEEAQPDYCIIETGLGGRLDATNILWQKILTIITSVSMDHMEYLGNTLEEIALEKAGILRTGVPLVYWGQDPKVSRIIRERAAALEVTCHLVSKKDYVFLNFGNKSIDFCLQSQYYNYDSLTLNTTALYQMENAVLAIRSLEILTDGKGISPTIVAKGLQKTNWSGRMEEVLPDVYLDGAHNEDGFRAFLDAVRYDGYDGQRVLLFGAVSDKPYRSMLLQAGQSKLFEEIAAANLLCDRSADLTCLPDVFRSTLPTPLTVYPTAQYALESLLAKQQGRIYIVGSLYLAGEIKSLLTDKGVTTRRSQDT